ncbi:general secretion pathway protein GspF [Alphaproteobacteria bacterium]|nr:general secretion pathway protein GspF [Alphaproteobacteria bacterium]
MPIYKYRALSYSGSKIDGFLVANDYESAYSSLKTKKCHPLSMEKARLSQRKIAPEDLLMFFFHIDMQLKCKVRIDKAIESFIDLHDSKILKASLVNVLDSLRNGSSLGAAFEKSAGMFDWTIITLLKSAEQTGRLSDIITNILKFLKLQSNWKNDVKRALAYPVFLVLLAIFILVFSICILGPQVMSLICDFSNGEVPDVTLFLLNVLPEISEILGCFLLIALITLCFFMLTKDGRTKILNWLLRIPKIGPIAVKISFWHFCEIMHIALDAKLDFMDAMGLAISSTKFEDIKRELLKAKNQITDGHPIGKSFSEIKFMSPETLAAIFIGEESGNLSESFAHMSQVQYGEILFDIKALGQQFSVVLTIFTGLVLIMIISGLLFPIYSYVEVAGT